MTVRSLVRGQRGGGAGVSDFAADRLPDFEVRGWAAAARGSQEGGLRGRDLRLLPCGAYLLLLSCSSPAWCLVAQILLLCLSALLIRQMAGDTQGHVHFLERAKARGDYLLVGLHSDAVTTATHGPGHPIMGLHERALCLLACKVKYPPLLPPPTHVQLLERPLLERHPVAEPSLSLSCRLSGWTISCSGRRGPSHETCSPP